MPNFASLKIILSYYLDLIQSCKDNTDKFIWQTESIPTPDHLQA